MPNAFDFSRPPFDRLGADEAEAFRAALDVAYYRPGAKIVAAGAQAASLFVVLKGVVEERDGEELVALLGRTDFFDPRALLEGAAAHDFVAREETLCYVAPKALTQKLMRDNPRFGAFFYRDLSNKLEALAGAREEARSGALLRARLSDLRIHPAVFIDAADTMETAGRRMEAADCNTLFVRDGARTGVVTGMNLAKAAVLRRQPIDAPVGPLAHYDIVALQEDDFVFMALLEMTRAAKRRVAIRRGDEYVGVLEDIDLLGFLAGAAQILAGRIDRAAGLAELKICAREIVGQTRILRRQDVRVEVIAEIVSDLNRRLFARTWALLAPPQWRERACLIVMGSEGRGEQTMRTDQDNGLILAGPVDPVSLEAFRRDFSAALADFGFPPCPGAIMLSNPLWSRARDEFIADFRRWFALPDETGFMNVAIFCDAAAVAGDARLLEEAKAALFEAARGETAHLARFAAVIEQFPTPIGFFNNLVTSEGDAVDLKKGGLFPIVQGVRALALELGLTPTGTLARIDALREAGLFAPDFARDLRQAFLYLSSLRLDAQLEAERGLTALVRPAGLSTAERDLLRDSFRVVKGFREILRNHFNLKLFA